MATGTGKSEVAFATFLDEHRAGNLERALIISHTDELVAQPVARIQRDWPGLPRVGVVKAERDEYAAPIVSASVQTLWSGGTQARLRRVLDAGPLTHVWIDETHRAAARTYRAALDVIRARNPFVRVLGTSATPIRSDGVALRGIFDDVAYRVSIADAIFNLRAITEFEAFAVHVSADLSDVRTNAAGDYAPGVTGERLSAHECHEAIIAKWHEVAGDRPTIAFTASVLQTHALAAAFREHGVVAAGIDGTTPRRERQAIVEAFRSGEPWEDGRPLQVLVGCQVFIEGFDAPRASCALIDRPTAHDGTYIQMVGRCLRWWDRPRGWADDVGHERAVIIDVVPKMRGRDLRMAGDLLGPPQAVRAARERAVEQGLVVPELFPVDWGQESIDADPDAAFLEVLDLFGTSDLAWFFGAGFASVGLGTRQGRDGRRVGVALAMVMGDETRATRADELRAAGRWQPAWDAEYDRVSFRVYLVEGNSARRVGQASTFAGASAIAGRVSAEHMTPVLARRDRRWRRGEPSQNQVVFAKKLGVWREGLRKGVLSDLITHALVQRALRRHGVLP